MQQQRLRSQQKNNPLCLLYNLVALTSIQYLKAEATQSQMIDLGKIACTSRLLKKGTSFSDSMFAKKVIKPLFETKTVTKRLLWFFFKKESFFKQTETVRYFSWFLKRTFFFLSNNVFYQPCYQGLFCPLFDACQSLYVGFLWWWM